MPLYSYVKDKPKISKKLLTLTAFVLIFSGIAIIFWTVFPIFSFAFVYAPKFDTLVQPIPGSEITSKEDLETIREVIEGYYSNYSNMKIIHYSS